MTTPRTTVRTAAGQRLLDREALREVVDSQVALGHKMTIVPTDVLVRLLDATPAASPVVDVLTEVYQFWRDRPDLAPGIRLREKVRAATKEEA